MSNLAIRSFAAGEIAPALYARTDQSRYEIGLRTCRNYLVMRQGGATKRPGTEFLTEVKDSDTKVRLIPFIFNIRQTFVLEFGDFYVRFITNGGQVEDPDNPGDPLEIESPYAVADLPALNFVQSGDVVTIVHPSYPPYELIRVTNTSWTLNAVVFGAAFGNGAPPAPTPSGGDPATTRNTAYVITRVYDTGEESPGSDPAINANPPTATAPVFLIGPAASAASIKIYRRDGDVGVFGFIAEVAGDTLTTWADYGTIPEPALQPPIEKTPFVGEGNYPSVVAYYQQRQVYANTNNNPDTVWASRTGFFKNFNISVITQDDDAIQFRLLSDEVDAVTQLQNLGQLVVGTEGPLWIIQGDGNNTLTPIAINPLAAEYGGMGSLRPIKSGQRLIYVQALGSAVRELTSSRQNGFSALTGGDATLFSSHLFDGYTLTDWAFQQEPLHVLWAVRSDGIMLGLTYIPEQEVLAWHRHDSLGWIENVCVVPEDKYHWLYLVVRRVIYVDGERFERRYIERMSTSNVTPLFSTPEEAAGSPGGIITPPPPPPPPPPSPTTISPPTTPTTTDVTTTTAVANWVAGNVGAESRVEIRLQSGPGAWVSVDIAAGLLNYSFTGLSSGTLYEWRVAHFIGTDVSAFLGPSSPTQFATGFVTLTLADPASAPVIDSQAHPIGLTTLFISWPAPAIVGEVSRLQIAGPTDLTPTDGEFSDIGVFVTGIGNAITNVTVAGTYWLRVRYEQTGFTSSAYVNDTGTAITVS